MEKETYAPKDDLNRSFNVKTEANSSGYESDRYAKIVWNRMNAPIPAD
jgi:hypothetical protein